MKVKFFQDLYLQWIRSLCNL